MDLSPLPNRWTEAGEALLPDLVALRRTRGRALTASIR